MEKVRIVCGLLVACALLLGLGLNNLWRAMPEFHQLDTIFSIPMYTQGAILIVTLLLVYRVLKGSKAMVAPAAGLIVVCVLSWYHINLSNSVNAIRVSIDPFYNKQIEFETIRSIKREAGDFLVVTQTGQHRLSTGYYPLGLNVKDLEKTLFQYGECTREENSRCQEIHFGWP